MQDKFMKKSKIGYRNLTLKIIHSIKFDYDLYESKQGHRFKGALSVLDLNEELQVNI